MTNLKDFGCSSHDRVLAPGVLESDGNQGFDDLKEINSEK